ncbi:hypothetical protein BC830DRAFT_819775 [Chytriomyces sp. MP71]|nr:hypothetical protein BC830DRAFT_819775 [Chytriomyces sp. MP71]
MDPKNTSYTASDIQININDTIESTLAITVEFPSDGNPDHFHVNASEGSNLLFGKGHRSMKINVQLHITLPASPLSEFFFHGQIGSLDWQAPSPALSRFNIDLNLGSIVLCAPLACTDVFVNLNAGSIDARDLTARRAILKTDCGEVKGALKGYESAQMRTALGSVAMELSPAVGKTFTDVGSDCGSVNAQVHGFRGSYSSKVGLGMTSVSGVATSKTGFSIGSEHREGQVGTDGESIFSADAGLGKLKLVFDDQVVVSGGESGAKEAEANGKFERIITIN